VPVQLKEVFVCVALALQPRNLPPSYIPSFKQNKNITSSMEAAVKTFFSSPHFAVVGASSDPAKFGHKGFFFPTHFRFPLPSSFYLSSVH
jgi:hypothetical protein